MKTIITTLLICIFCFTIPKGHSQETKNHPKKYYVTDEGKLVWQKSLPVYIFLSDKPEGNQKHQLKSKLHPDYTDPLYLDTEGVNFIRSKWAVDENGKVVIPKVELMYEIYRDGRAPSTSVSFEGTPKYATKAGVFYGKNLTVSANAADRLSGVESIYSSANGSAYIIYSNTISVSSEGEQAFKFYSVDNVGNVESERSFNFTVDLTAPSTSIETTGDRFEDILSMRTKIKFSSNDSASGVKRINYKIDDNPEKTYLSPISLTSLSDGDHNILYFADDNVANTEESKIFKFYLDKIPPDVASEIKGDQYEGDGMVYVSGRSKIQFVASDNRAGVKKILYSIDGAVESTYSEPFSLTKEGKRNIQFYALDNVNNKKPGNTKEFKSYTLDTTSPKLNQYYSGKIYETRDTTFIRSDTFIKLTGSDVSSGVKEISYTISNGTELVYDKPFLIDKEGYYLVKFDGSDNVKNNSEDEFYFYVDNTGPVIEYIMSSESIGQMNLEDKDYPIPVYSKGTTIFLGATDGLIDVKAIYYKFDGKSEVKYSVPIILKSSGLMSFKIRSLDRLDNVSESDIIEIFVN